MTLNKNIILLKSGLVNLPEGVVTNLAEAMSCQAQLMNYGYMLSEEAFEMVKKADLADIVDFQNDVVSYLKEITGEGNFKSLYGNFPQDVLSLSDSQKWYLQIAHYWHNKAYDLVNLEKPKDKAFEQVSYKEIKACTVEEYKSIFTSLLSTGNSLTPTDSQIIEWFVKNETGLVYPDKIPFKENMAIIARLCPDFTVKTVVDCLRVAVGFSGGDVSLPAVPKRLTKKGKKWQEREDERKAFRFKLTDEQKHRVLSLLENSNLDKRDMQQGSKYGRFIRLGEILQPFMSQYPKTSKAYYHLRNQKRKGKPNGEAKIRSWYSDMKVMMSLGLKEGLIKLSERPGEFLRQLDYLVRNNSSQEGLDAILTVLSKVAKGSSNKVIFEVFTHFEERRNPVTSRSVFIKGARKRTALPNLPALSEEVVEAIQATLIKTLQDKFTELPALGNCYIDEELKKIPLPTNMRSLQESMQVVVRGQRTPLNMVNPKVIRGYVHWHDEHGSTDLDLSATFIRKETSRGKATAQTVTYSSQRLGNSIHSGDVRHRRGSCAEYIDIDMEDAVERYGIDYVVFDVRDFDSYGLESKKSVFGFMARENATSGLTWQPETINNAVKLTTKAVGCIICILDLRSLEYIWLDVDSTGRTAHDVTEVMKLVETYAILPRLSVYDLVRWHVEARGSISTPELSEKHFLFSDYSSSYISTLVLMGV